jgi:hypothetical protein
MEYKELLQNPFWQKKRLLVLARDRFACQRCSNELSTLHIHHEYYSPGKLPWEYPDEALTTLCDLCHEKAEFMKWLFGTGIGQLKKDNYDRNDLKRIIALIRDRLYNNHHKASARRYMESIKILCNA